MLGTAPIPLDLRSVPVPGAVQYMFHPQIELDAAVSNIALNLNQTNWGQEKQLLDVVGQKGEEQ
jgi:hypothetical protein